MVPPQLVEKWCREAVSTLPSQSIATICAEEAERLSARKRAAERRVNRLKDMLLAFMMSRSVKRLEGEKATIGLQANGTPSLVIDDPLQIGECFFEKSLRFTRMELAFHHVRFSFQTSVRFRIALSNSFPPLVFDFPPLFPPLFARLATEFHPKLNC